MKYHQCTSELEQPNGGIEAAESTIEVAVTLFPATWCSRRKNRQIGCSAKC